MCLILSSSIRNGFPWNSEKYNTQQNHTSVYLKMNMRLYIF